MQAAPHLVRVCKAFVFAVWFSSSNRLWCWLLFLGCRFGGYGGRETPGYIPNPVVKPSCADGTAPWRVWESRSLPDGFCGGPWSLWLGAFAFFQAFSVRFRARLRPRPHDALWRTAPGFPGAFSFGPVDAAPGVSGTGRGRAADRTRGWSGHAREQEWSRASVGLKRGISCG